MKEKEGMQMLQSIANWAGENLITVFVLVWLVGEVLIVGIPTWFHRSVH